MRHHQPQQQQQELIIAGQKRPRPSKVHFSAASDTQYDDSHSPFSVEEIQRIWYQRVELAYFKLVARNYMTGVNRIYEEARGFERLLNLDRVRRKSLATKCVLLAHRKGMSAEDVATISRRCSEYAVEESFLMGCQDFCDAYQPHTMASHIFRTRPMMQNCMSPTTTVPEVIFVNERSSSTSMMIATEESEDLSPPVKRLRTFLG